MRSFSIRIERQGVRDSAKENYDAAMAEMSNWSYVVLNAMEKASVPLIRSMMEAPLVFSPIRDDASFSDDEKNALMNTVQRIGNSVIGWKETGVFKQVAAALRESSAELAALSGALGPIATRATTSMLEFAGRSIPKPQTVHFMRTHSKDLRLLADLLNRPEGEAGAVAFVERIGGGNYELRKETAFASMIALGVSRAPLFTRMLHASMSLGKIPKVSNSELSRRMTAIVRTIEAVIPAIDSLRRFEMFEKGCELDGNYVTADYESVCDDVIYAMVELYRRQGGQSELAANVSQKHAEHSLADSLSHSIVKRLQMAGQSHLDLAGKVSSRINDAISAIPELRGGSVGIDVPFMVAGMLTRDTFMSMKVRADAYSRVLADIPEICKDALNAMPTAPRAGGIAGLERILHSEAVRSREGSLR